MFPSRPPGPHSRSRHLCAHGAGPNIWVPLGIQSDSSPKGTQVCGCAWWQAWIRLWLLRFFSSKHKPSQDPRVNGVLQMILRFFENKSVRYLFTGLINTVLGYLVFSFLLFLDVSYTLALLLATVSGIVFNYISFGYIVYKKNGGWLGFVKIIISYGITYGLNATGLFIINTYFHISMYFGQIICTPLNILLSWLLINYWVYREWKFRIRKNWLAL